MKIVVVPFLLAHLLASNAGAQTVVATNGIDRVQAERIASRLKVGMRQEDLERVLATNGLTHPVWFGSSRRWTISFHLADRCSLALDMSGPGGGVPKTDGLLRAARILSNGVAIASITLTNAP